MDRAGLDEGCKGQTSDYECRAVQHYGRRLQKAVQQIDKSAWKNIEVALRLERGDYDDRLERLAWREMFDRGSNMKPNTVSLPGATGTVAPAVCLPAPRRLVP